MQNLKTLSKRSSAKYKFEYFSREHYHILFLKISPKNLEYLSHSTKDIFLHLNCFNVDLTQPINPVDMNYMNLLKHVFFKIFMLSIQHDTISDDGTNSK